MKIRPIRLLPCVVLLGGALVFLKGSGLVHDAYAQSATGEPMRTAAAMTDAAPSRHYTDDADAVSSADEEDVLTSLAKRRGELDQRQSELEMQANILAATESRVDAKIAQLKQMQAQITSLLGQRDEAQKEQIAALVKIYSADSMKAASAAHIFDTMPDEVLIPVAQGMKPDILAKILAAMNPDQAQKLTVKLADRLALPDVIAPAAALQTPAPPGPAPQATAAETSTPQAATSKPAAGSPGG